VLVVKTLRDSGRSLRKVETHSGVGFPFELKRANGVSVVRGAVRPSLVEFSGLVVSGCRSRRR